MDAAAVGQWVEAQIILFGMEHLAQFFKALPGLFAAADVQEYAILQGGWRAGLDSGVLFAGGAGLRCRRR